MNEPKNRMASVETRGPGRPTKQELEENPPKPAKTVTIIKHVLALVCPCCGKGSEAKVLITKEFKRKMLCGSCAGKYWVTYDDKGKPSMTRAMD